MFISNLLTFPQYFLFLFQNCNWSVLEKPTRQACFEVLHSYLRSLYSYTNTFPAHSKCFAGIFFNVKCQNGLNNCKANASQSPLGCLDVSIGYTDMIHVTHLSVMVLAVLFTFVVVDKEDCIVWSQKTSSFSEDQGFLLKSVFCRWETKKSGLSHFDSLDSQVASFSFCLSLNVHCWTTQPSSFSSNSSNGCGVFLSFYYQSLSQESAVAVSGAETTGPLLGRRWWVCLVWHHLFVAANG